MRSTPRQFLNIAGEKVSILHHQTNSVYILGTNHTDGGFVPIVLSLLERVDPQVVGVELCRVRLGYKNVLANPIGHLDTAKASFYGFDTIPKANLKWAISEKILLLYLYGAVRYSESKNFRVTLRRYREMRTYKLGQNNATRVGNTKIGAELLAPFADLVWRRDSPDSNYLTNSMMAYKILLVDRPVEQTYEEISEILEDGDKERIKAYEEDLVDIFSTDSKMCRARFAGRPPSFVTTLWSRKPILKYVFMEKRNGYMAAAIFDALAKLKNGKLVCIVGKSHVEGIIRNLGRKFRRSNRIRKFGRK